MPADGDSYLLMMGWDRVSVWMRSKGIGDDEVVGGRGFLIWGWEGGHG